MMEPRARPGVLIVDDEPETCVLLQAILEEEGVEVLGTASGGLDGVAMAEALVPDVVLMDLRMPDLDGVEATKQIKAQRPETQVIFLTFYGDPELNPGAQEAGAYCYLVKGCPPSMIVEMIRRSFEHARQAIGRPAIGANRDTVASSRTDTGVSRRRVGPGVDPPPSLHRRRPESARPPTRS
jgi:DNA-binding NarL/FixJ family response regulator